MMQLYVVVSFHADTRIWHLDYLPFIYGWIIPSLCARLREHGMWRCEVVKVWLAIPGTHM
jgi:hypothetical protein